MSGRMGGDCFFEGIIVSILIHGTDIYHSLNGRLKIEMLSIIAKPQNKNAF